MKHAGEIFDAAALRTSLDGDDELFAELVDLFAEDAPKQVAALRDGLASADQRSAERAAHTLKGAAANLCAHSIRDRAAESEALCREGRLIEAAATLGGIEEAVEATLRMMHDARP